MSPNLLKFAETDIAKKLAGNKRWTVSENKKPLDIYELMDNGKFIGAMEKNSLYLTDMQTILNHPGTRFTSHLTYYLDADMDNIVILDIEPDCPKDLRDRLTGMPCMYAEKSLSGKGIHMIFPYPYDIQEKYKNAHDKIVLKGEGNYYEILIQHYVTFTGNTDGITVKHEETYKEFRELFESLCKTQKESKPMKLSIETMDHEKIQAKSLDRIMGLMEQSAYARIRYKDISDYENDNSKYEYAVIMHLYKQLYHICNMEKIKQDHEYTIDEKGWILYDVASRFLPERSKHAEVRSGMPWLYYLTTKVMNDAELEKKEQKEETEKNDD